MSVLLRAIVLAALTMVAASPLAVAEGETCVSMYVQEYASGLSVIAETGSVIRLGFKSGTPGDGVGYVLEIAPSLCAGPGSLPIGGLGQQSAQGIVDTVPELLPLP